MPRQRVLLAVVASSGEEFVPACLVSAAGADDVHRDIDVLVLDDRSVDEGRGQEVQAMCDSLDFGYYRSPRPLGATRTMNLALVRATSAGYDHVFILRSDAMAPTNMVNAMIRVAEANAGVGSVTAWSNGSSVFAIPNHDGTRLTGRQDLVDWISAELEREFGSAALDIPAGGGSCLLIPVPVLAKVGLFDPVHGCGASAQVDWCLRSRTRAQRAVLAPSALVLHQGSATTAVSRTTVAARNEQIVALRYPWYWTDREAFVQSGALKPQFERALRALVLRAAARFGYAVEATWVPVARSGDQVRVVVDPAGRSSSADVEFCGFRITLDVPGRDLVALLTECLGPAPCRIAVHDRGLFVDQLAAAWGVTVPFEDNCMYPQRV